MRYLSCLLVFLAGCSGGTGPGEKGARVAPPVGKPQMELSAAELFAAFDANAVEGRDRYAGKAVRLRGTVWEISDESIGLQLEDVSPREPMVVCWLDPAADREALGRLRKGRDAALVGRVLGVEQGRKVVHLEMCRPD